jgi:hypothetical protein
MITRSTHDEAVARDVREWEMSGLWVDGGRWLPARNGTLEYFPSKREIRAKCRLLRKRAPRHGAHKRAPRGGEFAVGTTAGV